MNNSELKVQEIIKLLKGVSFKDALSIIMDVERELRSTIII
jgi:hypothetical protein